MSYSEIQKRWRERKPAEKKPETTTRLFQNLGIRAFSFLLLLSGCPIAYVESKTKQQQRGFYLVYDCCSLYARGRYTFDLAFSYLLMVVEVGKKPYTLAFQITTLHVVLPTRNQSSQGVRRSFRCREVMAPRYGQRRYFALVYCTTLSLLTVKPLALRQGVDNKIEMIAQ